MNQGKEQNQLKNQVHIATEFLLFITDIKLLATYINKK